MRTSNDILRSMAIYVAAALGDEWSVTWGDEEGDFQRPYAKVESATPIGTRVTNMIVGEWRQTFNVVAYPAEMPTNIEARQEAGRVQELLSLAFTKGIRPDAYGQPQNSGTPDLTYRRAHPYRMPIWDCEGVPLDQPVPDDARDPRDFAKVESDPQFNVLEGQVNRDDEPETVYSIVCEVRLSWMRSLVVLEPATPVSTVGVQPTPPTP